MTEKATAKPRKEREPSEVLIMHEFSETPQQFPTWSDVGEEIFSSTHDAELALRKLAKAGERYRIVTVHREVMASIEQREPKIKLT